MCAWPRPSRRCSGSSARNRSATGTDKLTSRQIDQVIKAARVAKIQARMIPLRLVIDTNIVVSAALKPDGLQRTVLLLAITKPARLYVSEAVIAEYREVLARPELKIRKGLRQQLLAAH